MTAVGVLAALLLAGCQRAIYDKAIPLDLGGVHEVEVSAPSGEQKAVVEFNSPGVPVDVWVTLAENKQPVKNKVQVRMRPNDSEVLGGKEKSESGTFEVTVPAGKEYFVVLGGAKKKTEVKVKITGK
jgi:hypothetical protein